MKQVSFLADTSSSSIETQEEEVISKLDPMTADELASSFYSFDELVAIVEHCKMVIDGRVKEDCERGLEPIRDPRHRVKSRIVVHNVLQEQKRQKSAGSFDAERLATFYHSAAEEPMKYALEKGKEDAKAAKEGSWRRWKTSPTTPTLFGQIAAKLRGGGRRGKQKKVAPKMSRSR